VQPGLVHAVAGGAWVADVAMPVIAFVSGTGLSVRLAGDWFAELAAIGRPAPCAAMAGDDAVCWVAPERCGAVYRFSAGSRQRFALPAPALALTAGRGACWAVLDANAGGGLVARITAGGSQSFATELVLHSLVVAADGVFALGYPARSRPGTRSSDTVVRLGDDGSVTPIAQAAGTGPGARLHAGIRGLWLETGGPPFHRFPGDHRMELLERSLAGWQPGRLATLPMSFATAVDGDQDVAWLVTPADEGTRDYAHRMAMERRDLRSGSVTRAAIPGTPASHSACGGHAWAVAEPGLPQPPGTPGRLLLRMSAEASGEIKISGISGWPDITSLLPRPRPPAGLDPLSWAEARSAEFEATLAGGLINEETGQVSPFLNRITVESVSLEGSFPDTECVIRFHADPRPGITYGRRIRCFDETGYPAWPEFAAAYLQEDIDGGSLPPAPPGNADTTGTIWI
jgi:hypothetical protein